MKGRLVLGPLTSAHCPNHVKHGGMNLDFRKETQKYDAQFLRSPKMCEPAFRTAPNDERPVVHVGRASKGQNIYKTGFATESTQGVVVDTPMACKKRRQRWLDNLWTMLYEE